MSDQAETSMRPPLSMTVGLFRLLVVDDTDDDGDDGRLVPFGVLVSVDAGRFVAFGVLVSVVAAAATSRRARLVGCISGDFHA